MTKKMTVFNDFLNEEWRYPQTFLGAWKHPQDTSFEQDTISRNFGEVWKKSIFSDFFTLKNQPAALRAGGRGLFDRRAYCLPYSNFKFVERYGAYMSTRLAT